MKKILIIIMITLFVMCGCKEKSKGIYTEKEYINTIPQYNLEQKDLSQYCLSIYDAFGEQGSIYARGYKSERSSVLTQVNINNCNIISDMKISEDYSYGPYNYVDGVFYSQGFEYYPDSERMENRIENYNFTGVMLSYVDENKNVYRIGLTDKETKILTVCDNNGVVTTEKKFSDIADDNTTELFPSDIKAYNGQIYIACYDMRISGNVKQYTPYIYILDDKCNVINVIYDIGLDGIDQIDLDSSGNIIACFYDYTDNKSGVTKINTQSGICTDTIFLDGEIDVFSSNINNKFYYFDGIGKLFKYDIVMQQEELVFDFQKSVEDYNGNDLTVVSCNDQSFSYLLQCDDDTYSSFKIDNENNVCNVDKIKDYYILISSDEQSYDTILNVDNDKKIELHDSYSFNSLLYNYNGNFYIIDKNIVSIYTQQGNFVKSVKCKNEKICCLLSCHNKLYIICSDKNGEYTYCMFDDNKDKISEICSLNNKVKFESSSEIKFINGDDKYSFYMVLNGILYGFDYQHKTFTAVFDLAEYNIGADFVYSYNSSYFLLWHDQLYRLSKSESTAAKENSTIILSVQDGTQDDYKPVVEKFNNSHNNLKIELKGYPFDINDHNSLNDYYLYGDIPDILITSSYVDTNDLQRNGAFTNLNELLKLDDESASDKYMMNIVKSFSFNDNVYRFPVTFKIDTLITSDETLGSQLKWTTDEFIDYCTATAGVILSSTDKAEIVRMFQFYQNCDFIDYNNSKAHFDSDKFVNLIKIFDLYGANVNSSVENTDSALLSRFQANPNSIEECYGLYFKDVPSDCSKGSYALSSSLISISEKSKYKKECAEFLKLLLEQENVESFSSEFSEFPINSESLNASLDKIKIETDDKFVQSCKELIKSVNASFNYNTNVALSIDDELNCFFAGGESAEEAAAAIQSKIQKYMMETR